MVLKYGPDDNSISTVMMDNYVELEPFLLFANAIRSNQTGKNCQGRLNAFFDFISLPSCPLNESCKIFIKNCQENQNYPLNCAFRFVVFQKERVERNELLVRPFLTFKTRQASLRNE